jgi:hypothetical protein
MMVANLPSAFVPDRWLNTQFYKYLQIVRIIRGNCRDEDSSRESREMWHRLRALVSEQSTVGI